VTKTVLILFAHPAYQRSRANRALLDAVRDLDGVTVHDLYELYPDMLIDAPREQALLTEHDAIVLQHPLYWYSTPALLKEWQDLVLENGWAYGEGGHALRGKIWMHALTAGGREESYDKDGYNRFSIEELLTPLQATAHLCGMHWRAPYVLHASRTTSEASLKTAAAGYRAHILALQRH
jgi:glutathione-regulated potassium-efflux system ancillary protein KefG